PRARARGARAGHVIEARVARLADAAGIEREYWDALGARHELGERTARAILSSLGVDPAADTACVGVERGERDVTATARSPCYIPEALRNGRRVWGIAVQLDALRSSR